MIIRVETKKKVIVRLRSLTHCFCIFSSTRAKLCGRTITYGERILFMEIDFAHHVNVHINLCPQFMFTFPV